MTETRKGSKKLAVISVSNAEAGTQSAEGVKDKKKKKEQI